MLCQLPKCESLQHFLKNFGEPEKLWGTLFVGKLVGKFFTYPGACCWAVTAAAEVTSRDQSSRDVLEQHPPPQLPLVPLSSELRHQEKLAWLCTATKSERELLKRP